MEISPVRLFYLLISSFFLGVGMGGVYDVHRVIRVFFGVSYSKKRPSERLLRPLPIVKRPLGEIQPSKLTGILLAVLIFLQDVVFFCIAGGGVVILNYAYNDGQFRFYTVVALFLGFFLYYFTIGKLVIYLSEWIVYLLRAAFTILIFVLSWPFRKLCLFFGRMMKKIFSNLKKRIAKQRKKVYNIRKEKECLQAAARGFLSEHF